MPDVNRLPAESLRLTSSHPEYSFGFWWESRRGNSAGGTNGPRSCSQKPGSLIGGGTNALFAAGLLVPGTFATTGFALEVLATLACECDVAL